MRKLLLVAVSLFGATPTKWAISFDNRAMPNNRLHLTVADK